MKTAVKFNEKVKKPQGLTYPALYVNPNCEGEIVLASSATRGVYIAGISMAVIVSDDIGTRSWEDCGFVRLTKPVTVTFTP